MTTSTVTIVGDVSDLIGNDYDPSRTKVWVQHNTDKVVTDSGPIRLGAATQNVGSDGTFSFANVVASTSLVENLQATLWVDWPNTAGPERTRRQVSFGPYDLTGLSGTVDIRTLEATQALDPVASSAVLSQAQGYRDDAEAARDAAQALVLSDLGTTDGQTRALVQNPASQTAVALSASIAAPLGLDAPVVWDDGVVRANFQHNNRAGGYLQHLYTGSESSADAAFGDQGSLFAAGVGDGGPSKTNGYLASLKSGSVGHGFVAVNKADTVDGHGFHGIQLSTASPLMWLESDNSTGVAAPLAHLYAAGVPGAGQKLQKWGSGVINNGDFGPNIADVDAADGSFNFYGLLRANGGRVRATKRSSGADTDVSRTELYGDTGDEVHLRMARTIGGFGKFFEYDVATAYSKASLRAAHYDAPSTFTESVSWGITASGGTATLGFFGAAPVARPVRPTDAASIIAALVALGLTA